MYPDSGFLYTMALHVAEQAVHEIASVVGSGSNPPIICGLARALAKDIDVSRRYRRQ